MGKTFNMVGGGAGGASYAVYGYAEEKTTAGSAGDIQVYPAADMTAYYIGATEPSDAVDGLVWLVVGSGRFDFPPVKNEPLFVPIADAKIYRGSVWETVSTKYFDGVEWLPKFFILYSNGVNNVNFARTSGGTAIFNESDITMNGGCVIQSGKVVTNMRNSVTLKFNDTISADRVNFKFIVKNGTQTKSFATSLNNFIFDGSKYSNSYLFGSINVNPYNLWDLYVEITNSTSSAIKLKEVYFE